MPVTKQRFCAVLYFFWSAVSNRLNEVTKAPQVFFSSAVLLESSCLSLTSTLSPAYIVPVPAFQGREGGRLLLDFAILSYGFFDKDRCNLKTAVTNSDSAQVRANDAGPLVLLCMVEVSAAGICPGHRAFH